MKKIETDISTLMLVIAAFACAAAFGGQNEIARWDSRMVLKDAAVRQAQVVRLLGKKVGLE